jgi:hypothetical protein
MAALPNFWGTMLDREGTPSGRRPARRESEEQQRYRQYRLPEKQPKRVLAESSHTFFAAFIGDLVGEERAVVEGAESDLLPPILGAIDKLMSPDLNDGDPAATAHAYQSARAVVESAYGRLLAGEEQYAKKLPAPIVTTDERGGVRLSWQHGDRCVRTSFAATEGLRSYLYFESREEHNVEALQPDVLSKRLDWMLTA